MEESKSFTLVSHNRQWLGAAFIRNIAPLQFGYLLNKSPQTSLCVFHVNLCAHSTLLYFAQTKCRDTTVMKLMLWNWATQPAGFEEHPWPFLRMRRCIEKNKENPRHPYCSGPPKLPKVYMSTRILVTKNTSTAHDAR